MHFRSRVMTALLGGMMLIAASYSSAQSKPQHSATAVQPIVIQGALPIESERMAAKLKNTQVETIGGWTFWKGQYQGFPVIISKTRMGMSNSAAATAIAIERYQPRAIINQGTAGGHDPTLKVYDIVLGAQTTNISAFKTPSKAKGEGSNSLHWTEAFDVLPDDESDPEPIGIRKFAADPQLMAAAHKAKSHYHKGRVLEGGIGSADVWNNELDRIAFLHQRYQTSVEEMEAASVAQIASQYKVPFLAIRIVSNNITNGGAYDAGTGAASQDFALDTAVAYMKSQQSQP